MVTVARQQISNTSRKSSLDLARSCGASYCSVPTQLVRWSKRSAVQCLAASGRSRARSGHFSHCLLARECTLSARSLYAVLLLQSPRRLSIAVSTCLHGPVHRLGIASVANETCVEPFHRVPGSQREVF